MAMEKEIFRSYDQRQTGIYLFSNTWTIWSEKPIKSGLSAVAIRYWIHSL